RNEDRRIDGLQFLDNTGNHFTPPLTYVLLYTSGIHSLDRAMRGKDRGATHMLTAQSIDIRTLHDRLGKVNSQPISVASFTNKRFTVNYRIPVEELRRIMPEAVEVEEIRNTGFGMFSMCACDFWVTRIGMLPVVPIRNN